MGHRSSPGSSGGIWRICTRHGGATASVQQDGSAESILRCQQARHLMDLLLTPGYTAAGALTGFVVGMTGVGGGALMTPLLLLVWGISPVTAVATDLWFAALTKLVSAGVHHQTRQIDWQVAKRFWLGSLPAAIIAVVLIGSTKEHLHLEWLNQMIASVILVTACTLALGPHKIARHLRSIFPDWKVKGLDTIGSVTAGAVLGLLVTLTSIGAGALG